MSLHLNDRKWACIAAAVLLGLATAVVFGFHPGGFETQIFWYFVLLPGTIIAGPVADYVYRLAPKAEHVADLSFTLGFSFLWYWSISFIVLKIRRALGALWG